MSVHCKHPPGNKTVKIMYSLTNNQQIGLKVYSCTSHPPTPYPHGRSMAIQRGKEGAGVGLGDKSKCF